MGFAGTGKIWMNGTLVDWADAKIHVASHVIHYGSAVFEGIRCYDTPEGFRHLPPGPAHAAPHGLREDLPDGIRARPGRTRAGRHRDDPRQRTEGLLHPPDHLPGLRGPRRQPVPLPRGCVHPGLGMGRLPGQRRAGEGRRRGDQFVEPGRAQHVPVAREDGRQLRQLPADQDAVAGRGLRRGHRPADQRLPQRGQRPEPLPGPRRRAVHPRDERRDPAGHHARLGPHAGEGPGHSHP